MTKRFNAFTLAEGATHVAMPNNNRSFGFTLAEVLITLGIIGVVAAMTMPTLINSTQGAQYKAAYKKALSAISQGVTLNVALDGSSFAEADAGKAGTTEPGYKKKGGDGADKDNLVATGNESVASILNARMNIVKAAGTSDYGAFLPSFGDSGIDTDIQVPDSSNKKPGEEGYTKTVKKLTAPDTFLFFNDGIMFAYKNDDTKACSQDSTLSEHNVCIGLIDVNGQKGPNKFVACDSGTGTGSNPCVVSNPTDIYPVMFYDQTILPASEAAKAVLYGK